MGGLCCPLKSCPLYKRGSCKLSEEQVKIHRFPINNAKIRGLWEAFVREKNGAPFKLRKKHGLCTAHFEARWVLPSSRISREAVPSIAPISTKKVLFKWDMENSRLVPMSADDVPAIEPIPQEESSECVSVPKNVVKEVDNLDSAAETDSPDDFNVIETEPCPPLSSNSTDMMDMGNETLDTVEKVEHAIKCEKEEAIRRYLASMKKMEKLEVLLNQLKESQCSVVQPVPPGSFLKKLSKSPVSSMQKSPVSTVQKPPVSSMQKSPVSSMQKSPVSSMQKSPVSTVQTSPVSSMQKSPVSTVLKPPVSSMRKSPAQLSLPSASCVGLYSIADNSLPPPLFDDYN